MTRQFTITDCTLYCRHSLHTDTLLLILSTIKKYESLIESLHVNDLSDPISLISIWRKAVSFSGGFSNSDVSLTSLTAHMKYSFQYVEMSFYTSLNLKHKKKKKHRKEKKESLVLSHVSENSRNSYNITVFCFFSRSITTGQAHQQLQSLSCSQRSFQQNKLWSCSKLSMG